MFCIAESLDSDKPVRRATIQSAQALTLTIRLLPPLGTVLASLAVASTLLGCARGAQIVVKNQSDVALTDVVVSGTGFSQRVGTIPPHSEARVPVRPRSESGILMHFRAGGKAITFGPEGYFEATGGYLVTLVVSPSLGVTVTSTVAY